MKKYALIAAAAIAGAVLTYLLFFKGSAQALQVNQVGADPSAYSGTITVTGVMAGTSPQDPTILGMFDLKELKCTTPNCNKFYLPVKYQGSMPKPGDEVRVSGSFLNTQGGYLFMASSIKVVRHHQIGG